MTATIRNITAKAPLLPLATAFSAGIITGRFEDSLWIPAAFAVIAILFALFRHYYSAAITVAFAAGCIDMSSRTVPEDLSPYTNSERFYRAEIISESDNDNSQSVIAELTRTGDDSLRLSATRRVRVQISVPSFDIELRPGYDVFFKAIFEPIIPSTDLPDEIDASSFLENRLVAARAFIPPEQIFSVSPTNGIKAKATRFRINLTETLYRTHLNPECKEFLNATLLGDSKDLTEETRQKFRDSGLSHVLALSGLHVGLIAMFLAFFLWPLKVFGHRHVVTIATIVILWAYVAITGFSPSVSRAAVMTTIYLTGRMLQRRTSAINSLMAAAIVILVISPEELFGIGFQLSFTAVMTIILFSDRLNPVDRKHRMLYMLSSYISLSVSAMLGTAAISAFYFHSIPVYFILSNIAVALLLPLILGGGIIVMIFAVTGIGSDLICMATDSVYGLISLIADGVSGMPFATVNGIYPSIWILAIYFMSLAALYTWLNTRKHIWGLAFALLIVMTVAARIYQPPVDCSPHLYIARQKYRTDIIIDNNSRTLYILTTNPSEPNAVIGRAKRRYADYMGKRDIDSIKIVSDSISVPAFAFRDNLIMFGKKTIVLADKNMPSAAPHADYLLICRGYRGSMADLIERFRPDTILIGPDLHRKRAGHYLDECAAAGIPCINLIETPWNLAFLQ